MRRRRGDCVKVTNRKRQRGAEVNKVTGSSVTLKTQINQE